MKHDLVSTIFWVKAHVSSGSKNKKDRMNFKKILILLFFTSLTFKLFAQEFFFKNLTNREGLADNNNFFIYKDSRDLVWISSVEGLNRFDGENVKVYQNNPKDSSSLMDNNIQSRFIETKEGDLWFSVTAGLVRYNRNLNNFSNFYFPEQDIAACNLGFIDKNGICWVLINHSSVFQFDPSINEWTFKFKIKTKVYRMESSNSQYPDQGKLLFYGIGIKGLLFYNTDGTEYLVGDKQGVLQKCLYRTLSLSLIHI